MSTVLAVVLLCWSPGETRRPPALSPDSAAFISFDPLLGLSDRSREPRSLRRFCRELLKDPGVQVSDLQLHGMGFIPILPEAGKAVFSARVRRGREELTVWFRVTDAPKPYELEKVLKREREVPTSNLSVVDAVVISTN